MDADIFKMKEEINHIRMVIKKQIEFNAETLDTIEALRKRIELMQKDINRLQYAL